MLWTPLCIEQVLEGMDTMTYNYQEIEYQGVIMLVEPFGFHQAKIVRLLSPNPSDYTKQEWMPGQVISFNGYHRKV